MRGYGSTLGTACGSAPRWAGAVNRSLSVSDRAAVSPHASSVAAQASASAPRTPAPVTSWPETAAPTATPAPYTVPSQVKASALWPGPTTSSITAIWHVVMGAKHTPLRALRATITARSGAMINGASPAAASRHRRG